MKSVMKNQSSKPRDTHRKAGKVLNLQQFSEQSTSSQKAQLTLVTSDNKTAQKRRETVKREKCEIRDSGDRELAPRLSRTRT